MPTLYELTEQVRGVQRLFDADQIDEQALQDTLDGLEGDLSAKAEGLLSYVANLKAEETALDTEIKRLQGKKKSKANQQTRLRNYLRDNMEISGITKIDCPLFSITLRKPGTKVEVFEPEKIPGIYNVTTITPDKKLIADAIKRGKHIPGCRLIEGKAGLLIR
jgi:hypothetical protein